MAHATARARLVTLKKRIASPRKRYVDPICGGSFRQFETGPRRRPQAYCPGCRSAERHRVLWLYLITEELRRMPSRILHVAPEPGLERRLRSLPDVSYTSTDLDPERGAITADLTALPFENGEFDLVVCNHVLEHIPDDVAAMAEVHRVLAPAGKAVMQHPIDASRARTMEDWSITDPSDRERLFFQRDHVRIYGRDFADRLRDAGFAMVERIKYQERLSARDVKRFRLTQLPSSMPERDIEADVIYQAARH